MKSDTRTGSKLLVLALAWLGEDREVRVTREKAKGTWTRGPRPQAVPEDSESFYRKCVLFLSLNTVLELTRLSSRLLGTITIIKFIISQWRTFLKKKKKMTSTIRHIIKLFKHVANSFNKFTPIMHLYPSSCGTFLQVVVHVQVDDDDLDEAPVCHVSQFSLPSSSRLRPHHCRPNLIALDMLT